MTPVDLFWWIVAVLGALFVGITVVPLVFLLLVAGVIATIEAISDRKDSRK